MAQAGADDSLRPSAAAWPAWAIIAIFWLGTSLLYAAQIIVMSSMPGENFRLRVLLAWQVPFWVLWAPLAPVVLWLGERFPLDGQRQRWRRSIPIHLVALLVLACVHAAVAVAISKSLDSTSKEAFVMAFRGYVLSRMHIEVMVYAATLAVGYGLEFRRRLRERELTAVRLESQLANARLDALRMQLNPHFLFNTLHTVAALVRGRRNDEAVTMIAGLSDLLRRTLDGQALQETTLADELTFVERYLDIQRVRFGDRLRVDLRIDADTRDARVPTLILQPLVENALRHGLAPRAAAGLLTITAARITTQGSHAARNGERNGDRNSERLRLEVQDDGVGWRHGASAGMANGAIADGVSEPRAGRGGHVTPEGFDGTRRGRASATASGSPDGIGEPRAGRGIDTLETFDGRHGRASAIGNGSGSALADGISERRAGRGGGDTLGPFDGRRGRANASGTGSGSGSADGTGEPRAGRGIDTLEPFDGRRGRASETRSNEGSAAGGANGERVTESAASPSAPVRDAARASDSHEAVAADVRRGRGETWSGAGVRPPASYADARGGPGGIADASRYPLDATANTMTRGGARAELRLDAPRGSGDNGDDATAGVGLANTRSRLRHLYGDDARLELEDAPGGGAIVRIELPYRATDDAEEREDARGGAAS